MDQEVGIVRTNQRLERASRRLELFHDEIDMFLERLPGARGAASAAVVLRASATT